jgi:Na+/phosphate symporter
MDYVHRRLLSIRLRLIEKCLFETKRLLEATAKDRHFILYSVKVNVDLDLRERIFRVSNLMIEQIQKKQKMKQEFNLQSEEEEDSVKKIVLSNLNEAWSSLNDMKEGKIRGHDQLSYRDKQLLNAHIIKLYSMIESIYCDIHRF